MVKIRISHSIIVCVGLILGFYVSSGMAALDPMERMEKLVQPGDVIKGHARFEKKCSKCHEPFNKAKQNALCRDCHEQIDEDVNKKQGFHGRIHNAQKRECHSCHTDHKGRDMDTIQLGLETFDHDRTNFVLRGNHISITCKSCHKKERFYRLPKRQCIDCHEKDDTHKERMGFKCENCHIEAAWLPAVFDHNKTDFPLRNNHKEVGCQYCHVNERYKDTPKNCYFCHYLDDVHAGDRDVKCHECHNDQRWSRIEFDHDEDTEFVLKKAHTRLLCKDCHEKNVFKEEVSTTCYSCHEVHDTHFGLYGKRCNDCHSEKTWAKAKFDHEKDTIFPLKGEHKDLSCKACHKGDLFKDKVAVECSGCHRLDDAHEGQEGEKCTHCHNAESWVKKVTFDHDITKFPLHGSHPLLSCEDCHVSGKYQDAAVDCDSCHKKDDTHKRKLGTQCERCHGSLDWLVWAFNHDDETDYPLDGKHKGLDCHACHTEVVEKNKFELETYCFACHEKDDNHGGRLGKQCERCHITKSFKEIHVK